MQFKSSWDKIYFSKHRSNSLQKTYLYATIHKRMYPILGWALKTRAINPTIYLQYASPYYQQHFTKKGMYVYEDNAMLIRML